MHNAPGHESRWSLILLAILQEMAAQRTNAVLALLGDVDRLKSTHHYPETGLLFAKNRWRAFYHRHETPTSIHTKEHGHFHIFTAIDNRAWAHVAGLSIDAEGQQIQLNLKGRSKVETLDDRDIYSLAAQSIDLQCMLERHLLNENASTPAPTMHE